MGRGTELKRNSDPWLRFYVRTLNNPKVQRLPGNAFKGWVNLLCLAKEYDGALPPVEDISFRLRLSNRRVETLLKSLRLKGLVDGDRMHDWDEMQYHSDSSTERVKQHRERAKAHHRNVSSNVSVTPQTRVDKTRVETETETETASCAAPSPAAKVAALIPACSNQQFVVTESKQAEYQTAYPGVDVGLELKAIRQWCLDNPARRKTLRGVPRFLNSWLSNEQNSGRRSKKSAQTAEEHLAEINAEEAAERKSP